MQSPVKIVATSDLHGELPDFIVPCDILIIAGDVCPDWKKNQFRNQLNWLLEEFNPWLEAQPAKTIVGIAGNHDFVLQKMPDVQSSLHWTYLQDSSVTASGLKIYGIPWVPNLSRWAFHLDDAELQEHFDAVPDDTDILVTHGPPHGYCDFASAAHGSVHAGFPGANDTLERVRPAAHICGHIHNGYGYKMHPSGTAVYNVAYLDDTMDPVHRPLVLEISRWGVPAHDPDLFPETNENPEISIDEYNAIRASKGA